MHIAINIFLCISALFQLFPWLFSLLFVNIMFFDAAMHIFCVAYLYVFGDFLKV